MFLNMKIGSDYYFSGLLILAISLGLSIRAIKKLYNANFR
jgi:hypothetical protein